MTIDNGRALLLLAGLLGGATGDAVAASQPAARVEISATDYPNARCNDETPATYYIRGAGAGGAISGRKWLIFLHGGGSCTSDAECAQRWYDRTGVADGVIGAHTNMTASTDATKDFNGLGILDFDGVDGVPLASTNPFVGFNRIMVPYCSSDSYAGRGTASRTVDYTRYLGTKVTIGGQTVTISNPGNLIPPLSSIRFSGQHIAEAVADLLMSGGIKTGRKVGNAADAVVAPPTAASDEVVIAGSSAGGAGVIRSLDNMGRVVHDAAANVKVFGIIDAVDYAGVLPDSMITGDAERAIASFYGSVSADQVDRTCQAANPITSSNRCFSLVYVLQNFLETPHFVVQQSLDSVVTGLVTTGITQQLATFMPTASADSLVQQYVRNRTSLGALELGRAVAKPEHIGYFIPNYDLAKHQLMAEDQWFYNSPLAFATYGGNDPRLGGDSRSSLGLPRSLACFRFKVTGQGSGCVDSADAKVINTTYPANPLNASYAAATSTLTLPLVRLSDGTLYKDVTVTVNPLGTVLVNDPAVGGLGTLNAFDPVRNVLMLPLVNVDGTIVERVSVSGAGLQVLTYQPASF